MKLRNIGIVIRREYLNKVRKKSFLVTTFLVPVLMAALCIVPIVMMLNAKDKMKFIAVMDESAVVMPTLQDSESACFVDLTGAPADSVKALLTDGTYDALMALSALDADNSLTFEIFSSQPLGLDLTENLTRKVNDAVENYRVGTYGIEGLDRILKDVKPDIRPKSYTIDEDGKENVSEEGVYTALSMILGLVIFMFITLFGGMVMSAVIEEKASRVVEVLISSVKATELMFGKIIGVALVALTQFFLWIVLTVSIVGAAATFIGEEKFAEITSAASSSAIADPSVTATIDQIAPASSDQSEAAVIISTISSLPYGKIILVFLVFFIFGYLLYASLYAAVGSAVESEGDASQLQLPLTVPLMLAYFIAIYAFNAPESSLVFWGSMIPFTSPIVMLARLPFGVETWELALSLGLLVVTCIAGAWASAKIYNVGILMFGKKSTFQDLWKWLKMK